MKKKKYPAPFCTCEIEGREINVTYHTGLVATAEARDSIRTVREST